MRRRSFRLSSAGIVALAVAAVAAASFGLAGSGRAAGPAICATPSNLSANPVVYASCVKEVVSPHTVTVGSDAVSITTATNEGPNTASHVSLSATFSEAVTVRAIRLFVNGSSFSTSSCTPAPLPAFSVSTVSCTDFTNLASGSSAKLLVRFSLGGTGTVQVSGLFAYGEAGNDNQGGPNGAKNDQQQAEPDSVSFGTAATDGKCTDAGGNVSAGDGTLFVSADYNATSDAFLPCTPAAVGVIALSPEPLTSEIAFLELAEQSGPGYAIARIAFTPLPAGTTLKKLVLLEDTQYASPFFGTYITVPNGCDPLTGLPPNPGLPAPGSTDEVAHLNDTCIDSRSSLPKGGGELVLHVIGFGVDPSYGG